MTPSPFSIHNYSRTYPVFRYYSSSASWNRSGMWNSRISPHHRSRVRVFNRTIFSKSHFCFPKTLPVYSWGLRLIHLTTAAFKRLEVNIIQEQDLGKTEMNDIYAHGYDDAKFLQISTNEGSYVFTLSPVPILLSLFLPTKAVRLSSTNSRWAGLRKGQAVEVEPINVDATLSEIVLETYAKDGKILNDDCNSSVTWLMESSFKVSFDKYAFTEGQPVLMHVYSYSQTYLLIVKQVLLKGASVPPEEDGNAKPNMKKIGIFEKASKAETDSVSNSSASEAKTDSDSDSSASEAEPDTTSSTIRRKREAHDYSCQKVESFIFGPSYSKAIINPNLDFNELGIGGLDEEFGVIFRRAFASRLFPPEIVETLGLKHVKGILLYGPPGTGKTLVARQIGKMLNTREPKIVNGPEVCSKWHGESEENIRRLFCDAEREQRNSGSKSGLHMIIFDEIESICKSRGSTLSGANDRMVNQLLSKIDGVDQLNNILVIGTTNRRDLIDSALLRPGRLEIHMEIGLPNEKGRLQILSIHTSKMSENNMLADDVNLQELVPLTKNFSGAELAGLVRAAQSTGMNRMVKEKCADGLELEPEVAKELKIRRDDFLNAIENDIKPAFGTSVGAIEAYKDRGIIEWGPSVGSILAEGDLLIKQLQNLPVERKGGLVSVLLEGSPNSGKTALAAEIAQRTCFPFIKVCTKKDMFGFSDLETSSKIREMFEDAHRSESSCVLVDNIEALFGYNAFGPYYSNLVIQTLYTSLIKEPPKGRRLLILCTTSVKDVLARMQIMLPAFMSVLHVPRLRNFDEIARVLEQSELFSSHEIADVGRRLHGTEIRVGIKKLMTLIDMVRQIGDECRVPSFVTKLREESEAQL